jgi:hypothetical protein
MKVKFISKKEREQLKAERDGQPPITHHQEKPQELNNPSNTSKQTSNGTHENAPPKPRQEESKIAFSEHFMGVEREEADVEPRERSRDAKYHDLTRD